MTCTSQEMSPSLAIQARQRWVQAGWHPPKNHITQADILASITLPGPIATSLA